MKNVIIANITVVDAPSHNFELISAHTEIYNVTILAPPSTGVSNPSHNTDGRNSLFVNFFVN